MGYLKNCRGVASGSHLDDQFDAGDALAAFGHISFDLRRGCALPKNVSALIENERRAQTGAMLCEKRKKGQ